MLRMVARLNVIAVTTPCRSPEMRVTSAASMATSVPVSLLQSLVQSRSPLSSWEGDFEDAHQRLALPQRPVGDAHPLRCLGVLDARLHGGDIVRLWTIPVSVSLDGSGHQQAVAAVAAIVRLGGAGVNGMANSEALHLWGYTVT